jgi:hypothetical protein
LTGACFLAAFAGDASPALIVHCLTSLSIDVDSSAHLHYLRAFRLATNGIPHAALHEAAQATNGAAQGNGFVQSGAISDAGLARTARVVTTSYDHTARV